MLTILVRENSWMSPWMEKGWGNGYVILPKIHSFHSVGCNFLNEHLEGLKSLTYADTNGDGEWMVGFDTCHSGDTIDNWPESEVLKETELLRDQLVVLGEKYTKDQVNQLLNDYYDN
jgi:hypothetical protein